jgi:Glycosyl transferase family 2
MAQAVVRRRDNAHDPRDVRRILDLIHLRYFVKHAPESAVGFIIEQQLAGVPFGAYWGRPEIHQPLWAAAGFEAPTSGLTGNLHRRLQILKLLLRAETGARSSAGGRHRRSYNQHPNFSSPTHTNRPEPEEIERLLDSLGNYQPLLDWSPLSRPKLTVSVLLCNYNDARYLPDSLHAICTQTRPPDEVVVVDDGSTDNSLEIIEGFAQRYPFVRVLKNERNLGSLYSINRALREAHSEFVVCAAADDRLLPNFLQRNIECLIQHPSAQMTLSRLATFRDGSDEIVSYTENNHGIAFDFGVAPKHWSREELTERLRKSYLWLSGNAVVASRSALIQAGEFDKDLRWHADYFTFWAVALRHGVCTIPETLAAMRQREQTYSSVGMSNRREQLQVLGRLADKLTTKGWRDIGIAALRYPSLLSPFGRQMLDALLLKPWRWPFAVTFGLWWANHQWGQQTGAAARIGSRFAGGALQAVSVVLTGAGRCVRWAWRR